MLHKILCAGVRAGGPALGLGMGLKRSAPVHHQGGPTAKVTFNEVEGPRGRMPKRAKGAGPCRPADNVKVVKGHVQPGHQEGGRPGERDRGPG